MATTMKNNFLGANNFNEQMKEMQKKQMISQQLSKDLTIEDKISKLINQISLTSESSSIAKPLMALIGQFSPLLDDLKQFQETINSDQTMVIYLKYRKFIKELEGENQKVTQLSKESLNAINNQEKFIEIQAKVMNMMKQLQSIHKEALDENNMILMWIDKNDSYNIQELAFIQEQYKGKVLVQYFTKDEEFRKTVMEKKNSPAVIIMSASAAGSNTQWGDGDHFNFLKQNQKDLKIKGVIIYCGFTGYQNLCHLLEDESRLLKTITTNYDDMMNGVKELIIPVSFNRLVPIRLIDFKMPNLKTSFIKKSQIDWSPFKLIDKSPQNINYQQMFKEGKEIITNHKIKIEQSIIDNMDNIPRELEKIFTKGTSEIELSKKLLNLYTKENPSAPVYNCLNSILNFMNEDLLKKMEDFIDLFFIAFNIYDDSEKSKFTNNATIIKIYRGSTIPKDQLGEATKIGQIVVLPSFSSFTINQKVAPNFISMNLIGNGENSPIPVVFEYEYYSGTQDFYKRPKCISDVADFPNEDEYVVYPFTCFKIQKVTPPEVPLGTPFTPTDIHKGLKVYYTITLSVN